MNKYAELQKIAILFNACRAMLRIKLATTTPPTSGGTTPKHAPAAGGKPAPGTDAKPAPVNTANGTTGGIAPDKTQQPRTWGGWFQDMLDSGDSYVTNAGLNPTRNQEDAARRINAEEYNAAQQSLARGEYNGYNPGQSLRAIDMEDVGDVTEKEKANAANGTGQNITINNNMPTGSNADTQPGYNQYGGYGGSQQYQSSPGLAGWIQQYSQYRRGTA